MAVNAMGKVELAAQIPTIIADEVLEQLKANLQFTRLVWRDVAEGAFGSEGEVLKIPIDGALVANNKAADTAVTVQAPAQTSVSLTLNKHKETTFRIEDVANVMLHGTAEERNVRNAARVIAEAVEIDGLELYSGLATSKGTAGTDITEAVFLDSRKALLDAKVPLTEDMHSVWSTKDEKAMLQIARLSEADKLGGGDTITLGKLGKRFGVNIFVSQLVRTTGAAPVSTHNLMFAPQAFVFASRKLRLPMPGRGAVGSYVTDPDINVAIRVTAQWDGLYLADKVTADVLYGWAEGRDAFGVRVLT